MAWRRCSRSLISAGGREGTWNETQTHLFSLCFTGVHLSHNTHIDRGRQHTHTLESVLTMASMLEELQDQCVSVMSWCPISPLKQQRHRPQVKINRYVLNY